MNCNSNHDIFLRANGSLVCWDDHGSKKELQPFDPNVDYGRDVYLGPIFENIRARLENGNMPFPEYCQKCICLLTTADFPVGIAKERVIGTFQVEPSIGCQLACPGCIPQSHRKDFLRRTPFGQMTLKSDVFHKIATDLRNSEIKINRFDFQGHGEPLLNKETWNFCRFAANLNPTSVVSICTHANFEFKAGSTKSGVNEIIFAIDGMDQNSYEPYRQKGSFSQSYKFMSDFCNEAAREARAIRSIWKYVVFDHNDLPEQIVKAQHLAAEAGVSELRFVLTQLGRSSSRILTEHDIPIQVNSVKVCVETYRVSDDQLLGSLNKLEYALAVGNLDEAEEWSDFLFANMHRLLVTAGALPHSYLAVFKRLSAVISSRPKDTQMWSRRGK